MIRRTVSVVLASAAAGVMGLSATVAQAASAPDADSSPITTTTVGADGAVTADTFPATTTMPQSETEAAAAPSVQEQAGSGIVSVDLEPAGAASLQPAAAASPARIHCKVDLRQYVHYSRKTGDTSWHWTWKCDDVALRSAPRIISRGRLRAPVRCRR
jgi:hypothetical protein